MGRSVKNFAINDQALTLGIPTTSTALRPAGQNGQMIYNTTTGTLQVYDNGWANISTSLSAGATITKDAFTGDGTTSAFPMSISVINPQDILVFIGGVYQIPTTSYSVSGTALTFGSPPPSPNGFDNDHIVTVLHGFNSVGS
jgi:hypothetical protein